MLRSPSSNTFFLSLKSSCSRTWISFCSSRSWEIYCVIWHLSIHWKSGTRSVCHRLTFLSDHTDLETALLIENADGYLVTFDMIWGHWYDSMVITLSRRRVPFLKISASTSRTFEDGHYRFVKWLIPRSVGLSSLRLEMTSAPEAEWKERKKWR